MRGLIDRLVKPFLSARCLPLVAALLGVVLTATSLKNGLHMDDYIHRAILQGTSGEGDLPWAVDDPGSLATAAAELFSFARPETTADLVDRGALPWWTLPALRASFFRPVAALTHWIDYRLWPGSDMLKHGQNLFWYAAAVLAAALLFRRFLKPAWVAGLAAILFAVDEGHRLPAAWLANRNSLIALVFGILALLAHDRWRREGRSRGALLAPIWLALSLLSAEAGIATCAFLACHALFLDEKGALWRRLAALTPCLVTVVAWRALYQHFGYGALGCGLYVDPGREPVAFLQAVAERGPVLLFGQLGWPEPSFYATLSEPAALLFRAGAALFLVAVALVFVPFLFRDRRARFFGGAMILAVVPSCGTCLPSERLLLFAGVGAMGLVALLAGRLAEGAARCGPLRVMRIPALVLVTLLLAIHLVAAPLQLAVRSRQPANSRTLRFTDIGSSPEVAGRTVVVVNAPSPFDFSYLHLHRDARGLPRPGPVRILAAGRFPVALTRVDKKTIRVEPDQGWLEPPGRTLSGEKPLPRQRSAYSFQLLDRFFRSPSDPLKAGEEIAVAGMTVTVLALTGDGRPASALFRFDRPLEDRSFLWLEWDWERKEYRPFSPPDIGATCRTAGLF